MNQFKNKLYKASISNDLVFEFFILKIKPIHTTSTSKFLNLLSIILSKSNFYIQTFVLKKMQIMVRNRKEIGLIFKNQIKMVTKWSHRYSHFIFQTNTLIFSNLSNYYTNFLGTKIKTKI